MARRGQAGRFGTILYAAVFYYVISDSQVDNCEQPCAIGGYSEDSFLLSPKSWEIQATPQKFAPRLVSS
jgi:hypothetical protein